MTIEITSITLTKGIIEIEATDVSEEHLQKLERVRDDGFDEILTFHFDTTSEGSKTERNYIIHWLHNQKVAKGASTYGEALQSVVGTITTISGRYLVRE